MFQLLSTDAEREAQSHCWRVIRLLLLFCLISVTPLADAYPPDPTWIEGTYDGNDGDEIIVSLTDSAWVVELTPPAARTPLLVAVHLATPDSPRLASADMRRSPPGRAPPLS